MIIQHALAGGDCTCLCVSLSFSKLVSEKESVDDHPHCVFLWLTAVG